MVSHVPLHPHPVLLNVQGIIFGYVHVEV